MQDSIELPSEQDPQQINFFVSPNNSLKKHPQPQLINTGSQQSLAYSSETHRRYEHVDRSPPDLQIPNFETSQKPANLRNMIRAANLAIDTSPLLAQSQSQGVMDAKDERITIGTMLTEAGGSREQPAARQDRRKTINKKQYINLSKKYKEMEYALQVQVINSEQLRTKVSILTQLLEDKIKNSQFAYFLNLKNTGKGVKNVDIFVDLRQNQKKLKQTQLIVQQQKIEIQRLTQKLTLRSSSKKQNINLTNSNNPLDQLQSLLQQKQSLFTYIEQLRKEYAELTKSHTQLTHQLQRYQQKQQKYVTIERPKLVQEVQDRASEVRELRQEVEELRMEIGLVEVKYRSQIQAMEQVNKNNSEQEGNNERWKQVGIMTMERTTRSAIVQTDFEDEEHKFLKAELKLLKSERDYYIQQYKKRLNESSENYLLKLQLKSLQSNPQLQS